MPRWRDAALAAWRFGRQLDWRPIRQQAETPFRLALLGSGPLLARLTALCDQAILTVERDLEAPLGASPPDLVVLAPSSRDELARGERRAQHLDQQGLPTLLLVPPGLEPSLAGVTYLVADPHDRALDLRLAGGLFEALPPERQVAAGRACAALRAPFARRLTQETALANARFALVANLPALLPGLGMAAGLGADLLVLTTNQIVLVYRQAALWGASLDNPRALFAEIVPVVGGALLWRTAARTLVSLVPAFAAVAPKVAVAYLGTYVVGELARVYYAQGRRPSAAQVQAIEAEARRALATVWERLRPALPVAGPAR
ncbi:MAG TPA: hypothetical protein VFB73_15370 [Chloroflexota bacterium]|nr:hypothetical protein [Chloroflexota bacterium]